MRLPCAHPTQQGRHDEASDKGEWWEHCASLSLIASVAALDTFHVGTCLAPIACTVCVCVCARARVCRAARVHATQQVLECRDADEQEAANMFVQVAFPTTSPVALLHHRNDHRNGGTRRPYEASLAPWMQASLPSCRERLWLERGYTQARYAHSFTRQEWYKLPVLWRRYQFEDEQDEMLRREARQQQQSGPALPLHARFRPGLLPQQTRSKKGRRPRRGCGTAAKNAHTQPRDLLASTH